MGLISFFALSSAELGVQSSTVNIVLTLATLLVIGFPLLFVLRSKNKSKTVTLK